LPTSQKLNEQTCARPALQIIRPGEAPLCMGQAKPRVKIYFAHRTDRLLSALFIADRG
jgi:hypothetical protein